MQGRVEGVRIGRGRLRVHRPALLLDRTRETSKLLPPVRGPGEKDTFFRENLQVDLDRLNGRQVVLMVRDPRDVAVSVAEFWGWSMDRALHNMIVGPGPLHLPPWAAYMKRWLAHAVPMVRYEELWHNTELELGNVLLQLGQRPKRALGDVVARQSFEAKRADIEARGDEYPFGKEAQLQHLRRGDVGEWRERFTERLVAKAAPEWALMLAHLGYPAN